MRVRKVEYEDRERDGSRRLTPLLRLYIEDAPHRRQNGCTISQYRECLRTALIKANILPPIREPIDLCVYFINPTSVDLDNLICALFRALDRYKKGGMNVGLMEDDSLIQTVQMAKVLINPREDPLFREFAKVVKSPSRQPLTSSI